MWLKGFAGRRKSEGVCLWLGFVNIARILFIRHSSQNGFSFRADLIVIA